MCLSAKWVPFGAHGFLAGWLTEDYFEFVSYEEWMESKWEEINHNDITEGG